MGRHRKPIEARLLEGSYRPDRHGDSVLQFKAAGYPNKPDGMSSAAAALWDSLMPDLNVVSARVDTTKLAGMCEWYSTYLLNLTDLRKYSPSDPMYSFVLKQTSVAWQNFERMGGKFGLTPADRAKLQIKPSEKPQGIRSRDRSA